MANNILKAFENGLDNAEHDLWTRGLIQRYKNLRGV